MMYKYIVSSNQRLTPTTLLLTLTKNPASKPFYFQPGQYAAISFKRHGRPTAARCFSVVSSPIDQESLQFSVRIKGNFTTALTKLVPGDKVRVRGAFGAFVFNSARDQDTVLLAGGIGITPYISMLRYATSLALPNRITLVFACQTQNDVPFADELIDLERRNPNLKVIFVIGQGETDKFKDNQVQTGRITPALLEAVTAGNYLSKSFFICGPPLFMQAINQMLRDKRAPAHNIITEAFSQGPRRQTGKIRSWPLNIYALGAVGAVMASLAVMTSDLLSSLPAGSSLGSSSDIDDANLANSRQSDLDDMVNGLPADASGSPTTAASQAAQTPAVGSTTAAPASGGASSATPASGSAAATRPVTAAPVAQPAATAPAAVAPKCTTTQSGVTTCV